MEDYTLILISYNIKIIKVKFQVFHWSNKEQNGEKSGGRWEIRVTPGTRDTPVFVHR